MHDDIQAGRLPAHASLPSERVIAEQQGVSRMTARRALEALELRGLAYSEERRGRFVSPPRLAYDVSNMVSFVKDAQAASVDLDIDVIDSGQNKADALLARKLGVKKGTRLFQYTRLFRSKGHAIFLETEYLVAKQFPDFLEHDLAQSTTNILEAHYAAYAQTADVVIRMRGARAEEASMLGLNVSQAGIELEQITYNDDALPICFGRQLWRGELAEFTARAIVNCEARA